MRRLHEGMRSNDPTARLLASLCPIVQVEKGSKDLFERMLVFRTNPVLFHWMEGIQDKSLPHSAQKWVAQDCQVDFQPASCYAGLSVVVTSFEVWSTPFFWPEEQLCAPGSFVERMGTQDTLMRGVILRTGFFSPFFFLGGAIQYPQG